MNAIGLGRAVGDDVVAHLPARRFNSLIDLAGRHRESFRDDLEVMDQRLHLRLHFFAVGQHDLRRVGFDQPLGHSVQRLLNHLHALAHFDEPNQIARPAIALGCNGHFELKFFIAGVGHIAAQIKIHTRPAHIRPRHAQRDGVGGGENAHTLQAIAEDRISCEQVRILVDLFRKSPDKSLHAVEEVQRRLHRQAADADVAGHHPLA